MQQRFLLIEDSIPQQRLIQAYLKQIGAGVTVAGCGETGCDLAMNNDYDLIIADVTLPGKTGLEICKKVKENKSTPIPVILTSTLSRDSDAENAFTAGADAYLTKPFTDRELLQTISAVLEQRMLRATQRILVVDDSNSIRKLVSAGLADVGFHVDVASNGQEALEVIRHARPDLILSDLNMPEMDGYEFCRRVKEDPEFGGIPFVVMSANGDRGAMQRMLQMGAASYIVKPFSRDQAVIMIEKILDDHFLLMLKDRERAETERQMLLASIMSLAKALDARDTYTSSHSESVSEVAVLIAERMSLPLEQVEAIRLAGKLHDIGKIGIPDAILLKPGRLDEDEFATIKTHPVISYEILKHIPSLHESMPAVHYHHEKFGGGGYPENRDGEDIPLSARVIAVADVWHAIYSDRPYRPAMPREKALLIIREERGKGLCPECVDIFLELNENGALPA